MNRDIGHFNKYASEYNPITIGSIDGTDKQAHDRGIARALHAQYKPNKRAKSNPWNTVFIGRLNPRTTKDTIQSEFSRFGKVLYCRLVKDIVTGKSKQYAFVEYESTTSMENALTEMHKEYIDGSEIVVEKEAQRTLAGWVPRRLGGGFGGRKEAGQLRFGCRDRPFHKPIIIRHGNEDAKDDK